MRQLATVCISDKLLNPYFPCGMIGIRKEAGAMMVSTKGRYALRFLVDIGQNQGDGYVPLKDVARRQDISEKYLEIIVKILVQGGLLTTMRGKGGGYRLSRAPGAYPLLKVLELTDGPLSPVVCLEGGASGCPRRADCPTLPLWQGLDRVICDYMERFTLADLLDGSLTT